MTYGSLCNRVLALLDRYTLNGSTIQASYNGQGDLLSRIPLLLSDGLAYITSFVAPNYTDKEYLFSEATTVNDKFAAFSYPSSMIKEIPPRAYLPTGEEISIWLRTNKFLVRREDALGGITLTYALKPSFVGSSGAAPNDSAVIECNDTCATALAYYIAAHLALPYNLNVYSALLSEYEGVVGSLASAPTFEAESVTDMYS